MSRCINTLVLLLAGVVAPLHAQCAEELWTSPTQVLSDNFGWSVDLGGPIGLVGEPAGGAAQAGTASAYFRQADGSYAFEAELQAPGGAASDGFGTAVAVWGGENFPFPKVVVVGAQFQGASGAVHLFHRTVNIITGAVTWSWQDTFEPAGAGPDAGFGFSLAMDEGVFVVGAPYDDVAVDREGSVYVYEKNDVTGLWSFKQRLWAPDGAFNDNFGAAVAVENGVLLVGAPFDDTGAGLNSGSVWVFAREVGASGSWVEEDHILVPTGQQGARFGSSVSLDTPDGFSTMYAAIGAPDFDLGSQQGFAFVLRRDPQIFPQTPEWVLADTLVPSDGSGGDVFGTAIDFEDGTVVVGAPRAALGSNTVGGVYVFPNESADWFEERRFGATIVSPQGRFGAAVAANGDAVLVGERYAIPTFVTAAGAAHLLPLDYSDCPLVCNDPRLLGRPYTNFIEMGTSVSVHGDFAFVGVPGDFVEGNQAGAVDVYRRYGECWRLEMTLRPEELDSLDRFGQSVEVSDGVAIVGAPGRFGTGTAFVYRSAGGLWYLEKELLPTVPVAGGEYGAAVSIWGLPGNDAYAAVGQPERQAAGGGRVDTYRHTFGAWLHTGTLAPTSPLATDNFGSSVDNDFAFMVVGADGGGDMGIGTSPSFASVYMQVSGSWTPLHDVSGDDPLALFGASASMGLGKFIVGAPAEDGAGVDSGAAYVYRLATDPTQFILEDKLTDGGVQIAGRRLGSAVAMNEDQDRVVVGASGVAGEGAAYVYELAGTTWNETNTLTPAGTTETGAEFGSSVALYEDQAMVGAPQYDQPNGFGTSISAFEMGMVYSFDTTEHPSLRSELTVLPTGVGGFQGLELDAGPEFAGKIYWILGTVTGTEPGTTLLGAHLPLNQDPWFNLLLGNPFSAAFVQGAGYLSDQGTAEAEFWLPPLVGSGLVEELTLHHAYIVAAAGQIPFVSEPVAVKFAQFAP